MDRRKFLKVGGFLTASVATLGLAGCGGGDDDTPIAPPESNPLATGANWKFPQSVASGDPSSGGILLWTRVVPSTADDVRSDAAGKDFSIKLRVTATDNASLLGSNTALNGTLAVDATIPVFARYDHTIRHKVSGLESGKTYFYQFVAGDARSKVGRFKTAPATDAAVSQLRFAFASCQDWSINHWAAYEYMAANEALDFVVHLGDYIYETVGEAFQTGQVEARHTTLVLPDGVFKQGTSGAKYASTLADYRYLYKMYRSDSRLQAVHERFAFIATWDDHEFTDDAWQDAETYDNGSFSATTGGDNTRQPQRRRSASQAWFEFMPADISFDETASGIDNIRIYRELRFGTLAHLVMTDERLYRSDHMVPEAATNPATGTQLGSVGSRYMVPEATLYGAEAQRIAAATAAGVDPLTRVSMLGNTQRQWWQRTMQASPATWKLWGNEVSLMRMGLDGTTAVGTLLALNSITTVATNIGTASAATGGNVPAASVIVAAVTSGATQAIGGAAATAVATADATGGNLVTAGTSAGLSASQAALAAAAYTAAKAATGATAQAAAAAQQIAFGFIKPDIIAKQGASSFVVASGMQAALTPFFAKFLLNADQWDGYDAERRALMATLKSNNVRNVVALTGDIHSFFAGTVNDDFKATGGGTPVMVDLVTAGISSDSFYSYLASAVGELSSALGTLVFQTLSIPLPGGLGTLSLRINLLDFTMGKTLASVDELAEQLRVRLRGELSIKGVPAAQLDATTNTVLAGLKATPDFSVTLFGLAQQLSGLNNNPWMKHLNTDAQGYAVVTLTADKLVCDFKQVNRLVDGKAPTDVIARVRTATVARDQAAVTMS
ncbi:phosphodiesterase [Pigmentiphaga aceris]|uniref:Phosphodiesterase n=1 Tax=Pigmentiphaga aceris TaxID=1940612 RepID=A0A5C0AS69_9BURK|nr:alkaline phosphatase D family protein [Pigmentiphaga aceris]QEI04506.1 phosphodiesterase [Pigmentiphaga aceris]